MTIRFELGKDTDINTSKVVMHCSQKQKLNLDLSSHVIFVTIYDEDNNAIWCPALLDSGSQSNFIKYKLAKHLKLNYIPNNINITGVNTILNNIRQMTQATIASKYEYFTTKQTFLIVEEITEDLPQVGLEFPSIKIQKILI